MCGIAGIVASSPACRTSALDRMVRALKHRGPDDEGVHHFDRCSLGHTRLSIVDLDGGHQPMLTPEKTTAVVFNGELYGYRELRAQFPDYPFRTHGDTELLLALFAREREALPKHLPGMFAFAIWDEKTQTLFCARDRFGEKPFYYAQGRNGEFVFASEIKAIIASGLVEPHVDPVALRSYLRRGYVHPSRTIYRNIHTLPPAHCLTFSEGRAESRRYWSLPRIDQQVSLTSAVEEFRHRFDQAIARQLVADVPVGAFLSGGLDSSTIVAAAAKHHPHIKTFSFSFGKAINELPFAREIAQRYETDHHEMSDESEDIPALLWRMQEIYDEPFGDSSNIPTYLLSGFARRHVTVALAGEGGDELTGGYDFWYRPLYNLERARGLPDYTATLLRIAALGCKTLGLELPPALAGLREGFFLKPHHPDTLTAHRERAAYFSDEELHALGLDEGVAPGPPSNRSAGLDAVFAADLEDYLPGDILVKTDRASMAWGLEMRCPFLDVDLASFCISLPWRLKIDSSRDKIILREAFADAWTPAIRKRSKQGFGASVSTWLARPDVAALTDKVFAEPALAGFVNPEAAAAFRAENGYRTWMLLVLGLWLEKHAS
jgi:asparagine synthase (glutamine-hydrolysing)